MSLATRVATGAAAILLGSAGLVAADATAATAAVDPHNCQFSFFRPLRVAADCYNSTNSAWYVQAWCGRGTEQLAPALVGDIIVKGTLEYGSGISIAQCPVAYHLDGYSIVNV